MATTTIKIPAPTRRNALVVAAIKRYGNTTKVMKDRRTPRGGSRNKQSDYREERY
jgi:hypothetical protein